MDFDLTLDEEKFREEVRAFLAEHNPPRAKRGPKEIFAWWKAVREERYVGFSWPPECGGRGGSVMEQYILKAEMATRGAPPVGSNVGTSMLGPTLIVHGTDEQKSRFLPSILKGEGVWAQGFSEPGAGSDLASLSTRAVREHWSVENRNHYKRDASAWQEDRHRHRKPNAALNLALTRNVLLAFIPFEQGQPLAHFFELYHRHPHLALRLLLNARPVL